MSHAIYLFNGHVVRLSTTTAHGSMSIGVNNRIMTALGRERLRVDWVIMDIVISVNTPNIPPHIITATTTLSETIAAIKVIARYKISEWNIELGSIGDFVIHQA